MIKLTATALIAAFVLVGCANQRFNVAGETAVAPTAKRRKPSFFVSGIGQKQTIDAAKVCGGAAKVEGVAVEHTFMDGLLGFVTFGIYTPRTARVYCK
jgi:hypothetical protein